jgi:predicted nucleotidyltransferase
VIFYKNILLEADDVIKRPIFHFTELTGMYETAMKGLDTELNIPKNVFKSFQIKDELCPKMWANEQLKPEIRKQLFKIAVDFFTKLELPDEIKLKDVLLVGSLANYNWSEYSDIDIHLVVDFSQFKEDEEFIKKFFDAQKNLYNIKHDIKIAGHDVEVYVQDKNEKIHAGGIYSIPKDSWKRMPTKNRFTVDRKNVKLKVDKFFDKIKSIEHAYKKENYKDVITKIDALKDSIKKMRQSGLEKGGEYSIENIVFKVLRRTDFMELLDTYKNKAYDKMVSVNEEQP